MKAAKSRRFEIVQSEECDPKTAQAAFLLELLAKLGVRVMFNPETRQCRYKPWQLVSDELRFQMTFLREEAFDILESLPASVLRDLRDGSLFSDRQGGH